MSLAETQRAGQLHQIHWGLTNRLLRRGADVREEQIVRELGTNALRIVNTIADATAAHRETESFLYEEKHALALSVLCALSVGSLPGVRVALTKFTPEEKFHPFSANKVEISIPHPDDNTRTVSLKTTLDHLAPHLEMATDVPSDSCLAADLVVNAQPEIWRESEDDFITRRTLEGARTSKRLRDIQDTFTSSNGEKQLLLEAKNVLCEDMLYLWLERRSRGKAEGDYGVDLKIKYVLKRNGSGGLLDIAATQLRTNNKIGFFTIPPWDFTRITARTKKLIALLDAVDVFD